ncbi:MAG: NADH-quinone oxidoreductase subunit L [Nitrospiraceae bacterium]|nr:NADH-quinone oxidoreductase subunit L [Nitrospiraceae bacterium]
MKILGGRFAKATISASFQLDSASAVMVGFVTFVGFLIHIYSIGYMGDEENRPYARYFSYLNLFMFSMLVLVLGANLPVMFVGWEGVGLCSYLLIGFYFEKDWCATAGMKAFITNRIGDFGFILGIFLTFMVFGSTEFTKIFPVAAAHPQQYASWATTIGLLLFVGAIGKSAQIPLYVWLPDAMAGPTPVSALIHAATMVTAGVYMVVRCNVIYRIGPVAMLVVAIVGGVTAFYAATIGMAQNDIKKVLAYSTVSQLGYMFLGAGVGAFVAGMFHVVTHSFFKALLFLGSGSVIHACSGNQDMRTMGGLKKVMPKTYWTFMAATLAISGIFPFAGFFSKDEILGKAFAAGKSNLNGFGWVYYILWFLGIAAAFITAFYMFRLVYMTFHGEFRGTEEQKHHLHESPWTMTFPMQVLGVLSIVGGLIGIPKLMTGHANWNLIERFLEPVILPIGAGAAHAAAAVEVVHHTVSPGVEWLLLVISLSIAIAGILVARSFYYGVHAFEKPKRLTERYPLLYKLVLNKYYVDEIYQATVINGTVKLAHILWEFDARVIDGIVNGVRHVTVGTSFVSAIFDLKIIDGLVNLVATIYDRASHYFRRLQVGFAQGYAMVMVLGAAALLAIYIIF